MVNTSALKKGAPPPRENNKNLTQTDPQRLKERTSLSN